MNKSEQKVIELDHESLELLEEAMNEFELKIKTKEGDYSVLAVPLIEGRRIIIRTDAQDKSWHDIQTMIERRKRERKDARKHWVASFHKGIEEASQLIDNQEAGVALTLSMYMNIESEGRLEVDGDPLLKADIDELFDLNEKTITTILDKLRDVGILSYKREKVVRIIARGVKKGKKEVISANVYRMNTEFFKMGRFTEDELKKDFTKTFKEGTKEVLDFLSLETRGFLFKLLKSIHRQSFFLVKNTNDDLRIDKTKSFYENIENETVKEMEHLNVYDLITIAGVDKRTTNRYIEALIGTRVLDKKGRGKKASFQMNPNLFSRLGTPCEYAVSIGYTFEQMPWNPVPLKRTK